MKEVWKPCIYDGVVYNNYLVSNLGNVKRKESKVWNGVAWWTMKEKPMKPSINNRGYAIVGLIQDGKRKWCLVHRLVANAFYYLVPEKDTKYIVDHKDTNRLNNIIDNLTYTTYSGNNKNPITKNKIIESANKRRR